jgi:hypothetical protein
VAHRHNHMAFLKEKQESTIKMQSIGNFPKQSWRVTESRQEIQLGMSSRQLWFVRVKHDKKQQYYLNIAFATSSLCKQNKYYAKK